MRKLLFDWLPACVVKHKRILKLFGESTAAVRGHVQQQTVLRIVELQSRFQFISSVNAFADDPLRPQSRRHVSRFVASNAAVCSDGHHLRAIARALWQNRERSL